MAKYKRNCKKCGQLFFTNHHSALYCGDECKAALKRERREEYVQNNPEEVKAYKDAYNNSDAGRAANKRYYEKNKQANNERTQRTRERQRQKLLTKGRIIYGKNPDITVDEFAQAMKVGTTKAKRIMAEMMYKKECECCGNSFESHKSNVKYCSEACQKEARRQKLRGYEKKHYEENKEQHFEKTRQYRAKIRNENKSD